MLSLQRWMRREAEASNPTWIGVLAGLSWMLFAPLTLFAIGGSATPTEWLIGLAFVMLANMPLVLHRRRLPAGTLARAKQLEWMVRQPSKFKVGEEELEKMDAAAADLEQIEVLANRSDFDKLTRSRLVREANYRMCRIFDLCCDVPGKHGLSTSSADDQVRLDVAWLARARNLVEEVTTTPVESPENSILVDLQVQAKERKQAFQELLDDDETVRLSA